MEIAVTHSELVNIGALWLNTKAPNVFYKSQFVCTELTCIGTKEIPDIIGVRPHGSILIEVKISKPDFLRDRKKKGRNNEVLQLGRKRLYLTPKGLLKIEEIPLNWGLLEWNGSSIEIVKHSDDFVEDKSALNFVYHSMLRRSIKPQVFNFKTK